MTQRNTGASVRARLLSKARADGLDFSWVLTRYALERLLYRLSVSSHRDNFLLKGALLFDLWFDVPLRPTRDIDLLGFGLAELPHLTGVFEALCQLDVDDGIRFDGATIEAQEIRKEANYAGIRLTLLAWIDSAKCSVQVDVGYGDAVTPAPEMADYPVMLEGFAAPRLRVYPRYTVVAEKLDAIVSLGMANSRMKDYFDLWVLLNRCELDPQILHQAVNATMARRRTVVPTGLPLGLSDEFMADVQKNAQWNAFIKRNALQAPSLSETVASLRQSLSFIFV
jgi:predicted nucleotidyltransferase component of viral defense system